MPDGLGAVLNFCQQPGCVMTKEEIAKTIRSFCFAYVQSHEGMCIDTDSIAKVDIGGIDVAAEEIARAFASAQRPDAS